jgi:hypothetical protein
MISGMRRYRLQRGGGVIPRAAAAALLAVLAAFSAVTVAGASSLFVDLSLPGVSGLAATIGIDGLPINPFATPTPTPASALPTPTLPAPSLAVPCPPSCAPSPTSAPATNPGSAPGSTGGGGQTPTGQRGTTGPGGTAARPGGPTPAAAATGIAASVVGLNVSPPPPVEQLTPLAGISFGQAPYLWPLFLLLDVVAAVAVVLVVRKTWSAPAGPD